MATTTNELQLLRTQLLKLQTELQQNGPGSGLEHHVELLEKENKSLRRDIVAVQQKVSKSLKMGGINGMLDKVEELERELEVTKLEASKTKVMAEEIRQLRSQITSGRAYSVNVMIDHGDRGSKDPAIEAQEKKSEKARQIRMLEEKVDFLTDKIRLREEEEIELKNAFAELITNAAAIANEEASEGVASSDPTDLSSIGTGCNIYGGLTACSRDAWAPFRAVVVGSNYGGLLAGGIDDARKWAELLSPFGTVHTLYNPTMKKFRSELAWVCRSRTGNDKPQASDLESGTLSSEGNSTSQSKPPSMVEEVVIVFCGLGTQVVSGADANGNGRYASGLVIHKTDGDKGDLQGPMSTNGVEVFTLREMYEVVCELPAHCYCTVVTDCTLPDSFLDIPSGTTCTSFFSPSVTPSTHSPSPSSSLLSIKSSSSVRNIFSTKTSHRWLPWKTGLSGISEHLQDDISSGNGVLKCTVKHWRPMVSQEIRLPMPLLLQHGSAVDGEVGDMCMGAFSHTLLMYIGMNKKQRNNSSGDIGKVVTTGAGLSCEEILKGMRTSKSCKKWMGEVKITLAGTSGVGVEAPFLISARQTQLQ
eukprot:Filipodium_phascolosomae@DN1425_c0_g1_i1.p1